MREEGGSDCDKERREEGGGERDHPRDRSRLERGGVGLWGGRMATRKEGMGEGRKVTGYVTSRLEEGRWGGRGWG